MNFGNDPHLDINGDHIAAIPLNHEIKPAPRAPPSFFYASLTLPPRIA